MSIEMILLYITSLIGVVWLVYNFLIPILDGIVFASGYTIFELLRIIPGKVIRHPVGVSIFILKTFINGFIIRTCEYGTTTQIKNDKWIWKPYFSYKRISK